MNLRHFLICPMAGLILMGCRPPGANTGWPEPRLLGREIPAYRAPAEPASTQGKLELAQDPTGTLTLRQALALALWHNPELAAFSREMRAAEADVLQAGLLPNPEVELEAEEFGGSRDRAGYGAAETTLRIGQLIELGGKRPKRKRVAALQRDLSGWDYEGKRLDVFAETSKAFVSVLAAQERVALADDALALAQEVLQTVSERVRAGKVSALEETKAKVALATARIEVEQARGELATARKNLSGAWGSTTPTFKEVSGEFRSAAAPPPQDMISREAHRAPGLARWKEEIELREATLALEKARRIPDPAVSVGVQRFEETDDHAAVVGISIPLSVFDRNQGAVRAAEHRLAGALDDKRSAEVKARSQLNEAYQVLSSSHMEAVVLETELLPGAQQAFRAAQEGYQQGKFGYLDVLDAQRTLFEAKARHIEALATYHKAVADVERLIGRPLNAAVEGNESLKEMNDEK